MYHTFLESLLLEEEKYIYLFLNPILSMLMNDNYPICGELVNNSEEFFFHPMFTINERSHLKHRNLDIGPKFGTPPTWSPKQPKIHLFSVVKCFDQQMDRKCIKLSKIVTIKHVLRYGHL